MLRTIKASGVIHLFAILHAIVVFVCQHWGVDDSLTLTILTMTMAVMLCLKKGMPIDIIAVMVIVVNVAGFVIGTLGAEIIQHLVDIEVTARLLATVLTTELLGWGLILLAKLTHKINGVEADLSRFDAKQRWTLVIMGVILTLRVGAAMLFSSPLYAGTSVMTYVWKILSSSPALIIYVCLSIICVRRLRRSSIISNKALTWMGYLIFIVIVSGLGAWCFCATAQGTISLSIAYTPFMRYFVASILVETTICCIAILVDSIFSIRKAMQLERIKAAQAQYRYVTLKQQVNPHFLFNSLNTLDGLVCEQRTTQASDYIHKLAHMYRYMLRCEEELLVPLREEIGFIQEYVALQKVRFADGFEVHYHISDDAMRHMVVPCTVQLLVENAFKHNTVSVANPLRINISATEEHLTIENNVIPKYSRAPSIGLGQKYISEHYRTLSAQDMIIDSTEEYYRVIIPLL